jgi:hypothetical protein
MSTSQLYDALVSHYRKPGISGNEGELLLPEVQPPGSTRRCDLLRVGLWASRGRTIDVHEIKVSRSDWLRELDDPAKAEAWWPHSSRFWIVAPPKMIQPEELPDGWGLMVPPTRANHRRFKTVVEPATRTAHLSMELLAIVLNRLENIHEAAMHKRQEQHREELFKAVKHEREKSATSALTFDVKDRLALLEKLEAAIGMRLDQYSFSTERGRITPEQLGEALREYTADHAALQHRKQRLDQLTEQLSRTASGVLQQLARGDRR